MRLHKHLAYLSRKPQDEQVLAAMEVPDWKDSLLTLRTRGALDTIFKHLGSVVSQNYLYGRWISRLLCYLEIRNEKSCISPTHCRSAPVLELYTVCKFMGNGQSGKKNFGRKWWGFESFCVSVIIGRYPSLGLCDLSESLELRLFRLWKRRLWLEGKSRYSLVTSDEAGRVIPVPIPRSGDLPTSTF